MSDVLSDLLRLARAETGLAGGFVGHGAWGVSFLAPGPIKFFAVQTGYPSAEHRWAGNELPPAQLRVEA